MERFSNVSSSVSEHAPLSMGIAILRYRLWNVDILINRTLVYGTLTGTLALVVWGRAGKADPLFFLLDQFGDIVYVCIS